MAQLELVRSIEEEVTTSIEERADHEAIALLVSEGARVLDIGCGKGALIERLMHERKARARGIEIDPASVRHCVRRGLSVVQGDAETDLDEIPSGSFDYVVLSYTLHELRNPRHALKEAARIGDRLIVSMRNAGHWRRRMGLIQKGRLSDWGASLERTSTIRDFAEFVRDMRLTIDRATPISRGARGAPFAKTLWRANWFAEEAVFLLTP